MELLRSWGLEEKLRAGGAEGVFLPAGRGDRWLYGVMDEPGTPLADLTEEGMARRIRLGAASPAVGGRERDRPRGGESGSARRHRRSADVNGTARAADDELQADLGGRIGHAWTAPAGGRVSTLDLLGPGLTLLIGVGGDALGGVGGRRPSAAADRRAEARGDHGKSAGHPIGRRTAGPAGRRAGRLVHVRHGRRARAPGGGRHAWPPQGAPAGRRPR